jgi:predicted nucleic acid-binding protein
MRIYLDLCTIQRPFDDASQQRIRAEKDALYRILQLIEHGSVELVSSFVLEYESEASTNPRKREFTETVLALAAQRVDPSTTVQHRTTVFALGGLRTWDAAHLAAAVEAGADFFCTCDDRLLRRAKAEDTGLTRAVSLLELIKEVER